MKCLYTEVSFLYIGGENGKTSGIAWAISYYRAESTDQNAKMEEGRRILLCSSKKWVYCSSSGYGICLRKIKREKVAFPFTKTPQETQERRTNATNSQMVLCLGCI